MPKEKNKKIAEIKSDQKNAADQTAVNSPTAGQSVSTQTPAKKGKGCLTCGIIATVAVVLLIIGIIGISILSFWLPPTFLFGFLSQLKGQKSITDNSSPKGTLHGKNLSNLIDPSKTITKRISAASGGRITAQTASGLYFTLDIGPGSLEKDTDISITPIDESPIEDYPNPDDPGVVIGPDNTNLGDDSTITVSEDPPTEPGDSDTDPGTGTDGGTTTPPGTPPNTPPGTPTDTPPGTPPGTTGGMPDLGSLAGLLGGNTMSTTPSGNPSGQGGGMTGNTSGNRNNRNTDGSSPTGSGTSSSRFSDKTVIIFVGYGGGVNPVPTNHSDDEDSITGPIDETGGTTADDPDEEESEDLADNAAEISGGTCSPEFLQVMANAAQAGGAGSSAAQAAIRDCLNTEWLNDLCVNDPVKLRRTHFEQRLAIARRFDAQAASEIESLMNQCGSQYHFHGEGNAPGSGYGVIVFSSLDASIPCGYIDDEWGGNQVYQLTYEDSGHSFGGTAKFHLPPSGGQFVGISHGENSMNIGGQGVNIPDFDFGFTGNFDGYKTIQNLNLYPNTVIPSVPIEIVVRNCSPLAPLPR